MNFSFKLTSLLFSFLLVFNTNLQAYNYNNTTLNIFSKIIPRLVLMSSQKDKLTDSIDMCIIRKDIDKNIASSLKDKIDEAYPNGIKNYSFNFIETDFENTNICEKTQLSFIFNNDEETIKKTLISLNKYKTLTIAYDDKLLKYGAGVSIFIGKKVLPYLNVKAISANEIEIDNILLRVSKIYREEK